MHYHNLYMQTLFNVSANYISHVYCYMHLSHSIFDLLTECAGQAGLDVWLTSIQCLKEVVQSHSSVVTIVTMKYQYSFIHSFIHVPKYNNMEIYISN